MARPILFLIALAALCHGVNGDAFAQDAKRNGGQKKSSQRTPDSEYARGNIAFDRQQWDVAKSHYDEALKLNADYVPALLNRGRVLLATSKLADAVADLKKVIDLRPDLPAGRAYFAAALLDQGKYEEAITQASKSLELDSTQGYPRYIRGTARIHKGEFQRGINDLDEAAKLTPNDPVIFNNRGIAWKKLGDEARAKVDFDRRDYLNDKQRAYEWFKVCEARLDSINHAIQSMQARRPIPGYAPIPGHPQGRYGVLVPEVPPEMYQRRAEAEKAWHEAGMAFSKFK